MDYPLFDVFISYAHEDIDAAEWLYDRLCDQGLKVFLDEAVLRFGDNIPARVEQSLEHSIAVLLLVSRRSIDSAWVNFESRFDWTSTFLHGERNLVPVVIETGCVLPARLKNLRACDLTTKDETTVQRLVDDLLSRTTLGIGPYHFERAQQFPDDLVHAVVECVGRYVRVEHGQRLLFESAIHELLDNARRHATAGKISLRVDTTVSAGEVTVCDDGAGFDLLETLIRLQRQLDDEPAVVGKRGLTVLEAQGARLLNGWDDNNRHWVKAIVWWSPVPKTAPDGRVAVRVHPNRSVTVHLAGRLDQSNSSRVAASLRTYVHDAKTNGIVFDMTDVEYVSSVGLRELMTMALVGRTNRYPVIAAGLTPVVREIFEISRFDRVLEIFPSCEDAQSAIDARLRRGSRGQEPGVGDGAA